MPSRRSLTTAVNLVQAFVDGEFVATTEHFSFGSSRGQRQTVEAELHDFSKAQGFRSRPAGKPPFAWMVGNSPRFSIDVLVPTDRRLSLRLAGFDDRSQQLTVLFNDTELGQTSLPADGRSVMVRFDVPAAAQVRGSNIVQLRLSETVPRQLLDEPVPLPLSGAIMGCHFVLPGQPEQVPPGGPDVRRLGVENVLQRGLDSRLLVLPAEVSGRVALRLPEASRVVLRVVVEKVSVPLEISLLQDSGQRTVLATLDVHDMVPRELRKDLTAWAGQAVQLDFWAGEGRGEVELSSLGVLVPQSEAPPGDADSSGLQRLVPSPRADGKPWSFLVVLLDAFARDRSSAFGAPRTNTPIFELLKARGLSWSRASSPASYTLAAVGSLLTGQDPLTHGVLAGSRLVGSRQLTERLGDEAPRLASLLSEAGWRTGAWLTNPNTSRIHGYDEGFDVWDELHEDPQLWQPGVDGRNLPPRLASFLADTGEQPFFAYVHVFEPHAPWVADAELMRRFVAPYDGGASGSREWIDRYRHTEVAMTQQDWDHLAQSYDARLAQADRTLGALLEVLESSGRAADTIVLVTSDHGESLGEHGLLEHSDDVYSEQVDIPFVMVAPGVSRLSLGEPITLVDLAPTVLGLAGQPTPEAMDGDDLLAGADLGQRPQLARSFGDRPQISWTRWPWRLVVNVASRRRQLFDLSTDPGELTDLSRKRPATFAWLYRELVRAVIDAAERRPCGGTLDEQDPELIEKLQQLGYVGLTGSDAVEGADVPEDPALPILRGLLQRT